MPEKDIKSLITSVFDDVANRYDSNRFFSISAGNLIRHANLNGAERMLDISTGTGIVALHAAQEYTNLTIDAVDISAGMLRQAESKAEKLGVRNIQFIMSDVDCLDYAHPTFDVITCGYGLFFFPDMAHSFRKIIAVLKPGGRFVFSTFTEQAFKPLTEVFLNDLQRYGVETPELSTNRLQSEDRIRELCAACGTSDIGNVHIAEAAIRYEITPDDWWGIINSAAYKGLLDQVGADRLAQFRMEHLSSIAEFSKNGKINLIADTYYSLVTRQASLLPE